VIVYVETNFLLELAFLQEEHQQCQSLLELVHRRASTELALPVFCVGEAYEAFGRKRRERLNLADRLRSEIAQMVRSKSYADRSKELDEITDLFVRSTQEQKARLDRVLDEVLGICRLLPLNRETLGRAVAYQRTRSLKPQDSVVYASVMEDLEKDPESLSCFITRNPKDFANPDIRDLDLAGQSCTLLTNFTAGLGYVRVHP
jgi:predicted nucleic acid-binding protein